MRGQISIRVAWLILALAIFTYLFGLDSRFAPKNGDEYVYMHITRMTAEAQTWLPLQSALEGMQNTKPPLLFWQGIATAGWGNHWSLWNLRWPSVLYTGLTAFFLFLAVRRFTRDWRTGCLAAFIWLSFFASYRYGRPFLTDPPEVFWLTLPFFALLYWGRAAFESKWLFPFCAAGCFGIAFLYKSFAYVVPVCLAISLWYWRFRHRSITQVMRSDGLKIIGIGILALAIFSLWFVIDPEPAAVWREFVVGENAGKFEIRNFAYLQDLLWGGDSLWMLLVAFLANTGLFIFVLLSTLAQSWRERHRSSMEEVLLWLLILTFLLIFSLPSQRSGRYLLPVMPAVAALIAIHWNRLPLWGFQLALLLELLIVLAFVWFGWNLSWPFAFWHWVLLAAALGTVLIGLWRREATKLSALVSSFIACTLLASSLGPLESQLGRYSPTTIAAIENQDVWVPCDYRAKDEEYRLLMPGARIHGYQQDAAHNIAKLSSQYPLFAVHSSPAEQLVLCEGCKIIGQRSEMRARQSEDEILAILLGQINQNLFLNEYLIAAPAVDLSTSLRLKEACR
ncbi:phospholipid carrier-dependent glycosyltransferase [Polynucleobacter sp. IMCC30063]|uniref:ArnT family glycosyltransferase n=1 Tax=unclassified Polynucleobacter TaxID=2640945 RepID=UPI001F322A3B|nr:MULTISPECIES: phospholipid carrier-dependent glycosyltransferase [unclassified Polynucleobacter]MCE7506481.1 phospholipid carrier-dependent glycosyltransferase [Polynucleobacter sp. IMCC30063]MCE7529570.1 phospholipid carrier-dependent glycosyltransferase [Polynucleobacter sp. IMCC 29146]